MPTSRASKETATVTSRRVILSVTRAGITSVQWLKPGEGKGLGKSRAPTLLGFALTTAPAANTAGHAFVWVDRIQTLPTPCWTTPGRIPESQSSLVRSAPPTQTYRRTPFYSRKALLGSSRWAQPVSHCGDASAVWLERLVCWIITADGIGPEGSSASPRLCFYSDRNDVDSRR